MEIATSMRELIDNFTNFINVLKRTADAAFIMYQHEVLADRLSALERDHIDMRSKLQMHKYVNYISNVKLNSSLPPRLVNQLVLYNQPHPVVSFKPKQIFQRLNT